MIASPPVRRCEAKLATYRVGGYGEEPVQCHVTRGLRTWDGHAYCAVHQRHVMAIARRARTYHADCGGYLDASGCSNPACSKWSGPFA